MLLTCALYGGKKKKAVWGWQTCLHWTHLAQPSRAALFKQTARPPDTCAEEGEEGEASRRLGTGPWALPTSPPRDSPTARQNPGRAMPHARLCSCWGGRVLPLLLAYVCYLLLGATVFQLLEKQAEAQSRDQFQFEKLRFLENYTCLDQRALEQFVQVKGRGWCRMAGRMRVLVAGPELPPRGCCPAQKRRVVGAGSQPRPGAGFWPQV